MSRTCRRTSLERDGVDDRRVISGIIHTLKCGGRWQDGPASYGDDFTREPLALVVDTSIGGHRMARELDALIARRGKALIIISDNSLPRT